MAIITFKRNAVERIRSAVDWTEAMRRTLAGQRLPGGPEQNSFMAFITGFDLKPSTNPNASGLRYAYSFLKVMPCADDEAELLIDNTLAYRFEPNLIRYTHSAVELNNRNVPVNSIVQMYFTHMVDEQDRFTDPDTGEERGVTYKAPRYAFSHERDRVEMALPVHDHRDAVTGGGFAFAIFHPGTGLPQRPWAL